MEVDRVPGMGGVDHDATPSWNANRAKRRKFVEEVPEPEPDSPQEDAPQDEEEKHEGGLDVIA